MSATGLLEIKRRINSVKNTQKITRAMGLISISKLRIAKIRLEENLEYFNKLNEIKKEIFYLARHENNVFTKESKEGEKLFIVLASNSGLCGGFNGGCLEYINSNYENEKKNLKVIVIGKRGLSYVKKYGLTLYKEYEEIEDKNQSGSIKDIVYNVMDKYTKGDFKEINIVYTKYFSAIKQEVVEEKIFPLVNEFSENEELHEEEVFNVEMDINNLLNIFIYRYVEGLIVNCIFNSKTSEQSIRMQAMNGATKNADEILKSLIAKYNRIRQSAITQEISEIVSGSEAQK